MALINPGYGSTEDLIGVVSENFGRAFTITSATLTVTDAEGTVLRDSVACTVDNALKQVYYTETFTDDNGYAPDTQYYATFRYLMSTGHTPWFEDSFVVQAARDLAPDPVA